MALAISTICDSIKALSITGLKIYDLDDFPDQADTRSQAVLMPRPDNFVTDFNVVRDSTNGLKTATYTLNYILLYDVVGMSRKLSDDWSDMIEMLFSVLDKIISNDNLSGAVDITPRGIGSIGPLSDPAGEIHHGAEIALIVTEFIN